MFWWLRRRAGELFGAPRSGRWPKVRAEAIRRQPFCEACGRAKDLEVHHVIPVHVAKEIGRPELELDPSNLVVLCGDPCHLVHGHLMSWSRHNPVVREDCRRYRQQIEAAKPAKAATQPSAER